MSIRKDIKQLALAAVILVPGLVHAAVILPGFDIVDMGSDSGATVTNTSFSIEATVFQIVFDDSSLNIDITDEAFTLTSASGSYDPLADSGFGYGSFGGTFTVGGGLLTGTFSNLEVFGFGDDINYDFESDLIFTSGSLQGGFTGGRIEGVISGDILQAKLGEVVVPVPAAVWLFGSGLLGLVGVARRKIS